MSGNKILILGAGPTGLGAARRLEELGHHDWMLLEGSNKAGGLASSFVDEKGFTWDVGGHIQFSHYEYFDRAMDELLGADGWLQHERESWVWMRDRFIPYPFQNNIRHLPPDELDRCLAGLRAIAGRETAQPANFREWILATFGQGIADVFMLPYNFKVWAFPPEMMSTGWVDERVAVTDLQRVLQNIEQAHDDVSWGPNNKFRFPLRGGTGIIWEKCAERLPQDRLKFNSLATSIDLEKREVRTSDGRTFQYDTLISTIPLRELIRLSGQSQLNESAEKGLLYSSSNIFGIGLRGAPPEELRTKCWMYFPENNCPFYRITVFSNYSPNNVPDSATTWSLMAEVSESPHKPVDQERLLEEVIEGLLKTRLVKQREDIISTWKYRASYGYPTPGLERDAALARILPFFESKQVYSRGRFGLWKYEVSNQDHSFMQGVEVVERLLNGRAEVTAQNPTLANSKKHPWPFESSRNEKDSVDITLVGNYPNDENESMVRYAEMLKRLLAGRGCRVEIIRPEPFFGRLKRSSRGLGKWLGYIDKYVLFPISLRRYVRKKKEAGEFLVHICDHSNAVYTQWLKDIPHLVTCHDVMAILSAHDMIPGQKTGWSGRLLQGWILSGLRNGYVICDTPETRQDLLKLAPEMESRSETVELPLNYPYAPMPEDEAVAQLDKISDSFRPGTDRFLLHVGGNQWYKNREGVIRIYAQVCASHPDLMQSRPLKLVMVGKPPTEAMLRLVEEKGIRENVLFVTSVSDRQLCALYSLAAVMVYPSLKEGFGWPIIEAQACGCPVVTSDRAPMNRLAGLAGLLADPEDESGFGGQVFKLLNEPLEAQKNRKEESVRNSRKFDSGAFLDQMLLVYRKLAKKI